MKAHELPAGQHHIGGAYDVEHLSGPERVQAGAAGRKPAGQRGAQVRGVDRQRQPAARQHAVHAPQPGAGPHDTDLADRIDVGLVEVGQIEHEPAVVGHSAAERSRGRATHRDRSGRGARPAQRLDDFHRFVWQEDEVGQGSCELSREDPAEVDVLVAIGLGQQRRIDHETRGARRGGRVVETAGRDEVSRKRQRQPPRTLTRRAHAQWQAADQHPRQRGQAVGVRNVEGKRGERA